MKKILLSTAIVMGIFIAKAQNAGDLDSTFANNGFTSTAIKDDAEVTSMVIQNDGKIVLAGYTEDNSSGDSFLALARYNTDGSLDNSFGTGGTVTTPDFYAEWASVALQADGKIVVAGTTEGGTGSDDIILIRYNSDGSLDNTFGSGGVSITDIGTIEGIVAGASEYIFGLALQSDGKIVVTGLYYTYDSSNEHDDVLTARFNTNGALDNTFGTNGYAITEFVSDTAYHYGTGVATQADGKIVVSAGYSFDNSGGASTVLRYNSNGTLDNSFGTGGVAALLNDDELWVGMAIQSDGKIVVSGQAQDNNGDFLIVRYNADGTLDNGFGTGGRAVADIGSNSNDEASQHVLQADGKIVAVGSTDNGSTNDIALARFNSDGTLDNTFGTGGKVTSNFGFTGQEAYAVALQSDNKIVAGGLHYGNSEFIIARYLNDDPTAIRENSIFANVSVYPNPAHDYVNVTNLPAGSILTITNLAGKVIYTNTTGEEKTSINTTDFANGTYFIQIENIVNVVRLKLVVIR